MYDYAIKHNVDYITCSVKKWIIPDDVIGKPETCSPTIGNYKQAIKYPCGCLVQWDSRNPRMKVHVTLSGKTLDIWREMRISDIDTLKHLKSLENVKFGRIDIAVTAQKEGIEFTPEYAWKLYQSGQMQSSLTADKPVVDIDKKVETFYVGSRKTRKRLLRIYDKGLDLGIEANKIIRIELESRSAAKTVVNEVEQGRNIAGIIRRVVDFDDNHWRDIMDCEPLPRLRIEGEYDDKSIDSKKQWLMNSVAPAMAALAHEIGWDDEFWDRFTSRTAYHYNDKLK